MEAREIPNGERVFIFETVTGNQFGEFGTIEDFEKGQYFVRAADKSLFMVPRNQIQRAGEKTYFGDGSPRWSARREGLVVMK